MSCDNCCPQAPTIEVGLPGPPGPQGPPGATGPQGPPGDPQALNPAGCNAAQNTPAGLLVPSTNLAPMAAQAPAPVGANRSVDVVLTHPGGCPDQWQLGARLSPWFGQAALGTARPLGANSTWVNTALTIRLPEPGRYAVHWDVSGQICATANTASNRWSMARVFNHGTNGPMGGTTRVVAQHQFSMNPGSSMQACVSGHASISHIVGAAAPLTLRLQGWLGGPTGAVQSASIRAGQTFVSAHKITD